MQADRGIAARPYQIGTELREQARAALLVAVHQQHILPSQCPQDGEVDGDRGLADAALGIANSQESRLRSDLLVSAE